MDQEQGVWVRVAVVDPLPAQLERDRVVAMDNQEFAAMVRTHLMPRENQVAGRHRWQALWALLADDEPLRERTRTTLSTMIATTRDALVLDDFARGQRQRAVKFMRFCHQGLQRLEGTPGPAVP